MLALFFIFIRIPLYKTLFICYDDLSTDEHGDGGATICRLQDVASVYRCVVNRASHSTTACAGVRVPSRSVFHGPNHRRAGPFSLHEKNLITP